MLVLIKLILAHLIGDFLLQPTSWVQEKESRKAASPKLYIHVLIHGLLILILLWDLSLWYLAVSVAVVHLAIDLTKLYAQKIKTKTTWFIADQAMHLVSIVIIWASFTNVAVDWQSIFENPSTLGLITLVLFLTQPTSIILSNLLKKWSDSIPSQPDQSLQDAGKYIGILERLFVFTFIVTGNWEAVGFLLAAKSVFRFGDLKKSKERKLTEYILIGTLLSFGTAMISGLIYLSISN
ncbi:uncharacterized protein DUF3307 [Algoriphagus ratkowskyi]|uniref:DUF3307 domain-containing protein n=1 Tax=Algoriphagus ratkowskyi TaxID=57028 RepID=A0A2W7R3I1_9BACT|nr:DUF3307 domain-containing protein [Algoriphagus ratkowskyi]PZX55373.1 uncharacterized protein DUF3307 [Algoriphagus ratkowskyi]TXD79698.1 DUF3307 domain-containing protein [Algoriphagus ratkowskyi]